MRVLVTGSAGQVGRALLASVPNGIQVLAPDRQELDVANSSAVDAVVKEFNPDVIINAAAYTAVDQAEGEPEAAWQANAVAPEHLARAASRRARCRLVHISTDYVFSGERSRPYLTTDDTCPLGAYGRSKLAGEQAVLRELGVQAAVVRTSWVYSHQNGNFLGTMLRLMRERGMVRVVSDQVGSPTAAPSLAEALWMFAAREELSGIHHWTDAGVASWYDFAVAIAEEAGALLLVPAAVEVVPIPTEEFPTRARRPANSLLDKRHTVAALGFSPRHWRRQLRLVLQALPRDVH